MFDRIDAAVYHPLRKAVYLFRGPEYIKFVPGEGVENHDGSKVRRLGITGWTSLPAEFRSGIDAALCYENGYLYLFKGSHYVKYKPGEGVEDSADGPVRTIGHTGWKSFPDEFHSGIDAALYSPELGHAYFFKGDRYLKFKPGEGVVAYAGSDVRSLGAPGWGDLRKPFPDGVDAAFYHPEKERIYFFRDREYVRWNPGQGIDSRYPRRLGILHRADGGWPGLGTLIGAPFAGNVGQDAASIWTWFTGGRRPRDVAVYLNGDPLVDPVFEAPDLGSEADRVNDGIRDVDSGSRIRHLVLSGLSPRTRYEVEFRRADDDLPIESISFRTAPSPLHAGRIRLGLGSCANTSWHAGLGTAEAAAGKQLDLFLLCGDNCYYYDEDVSSTGGDAGSGVHDWQSVEKMLKRHLCTRGNPDFLPLSERVPMFSTWDDHDFSYNNCEGARSSSHPWVGRGTSAGVYRAMWNHPFPAGRDHLYYDFRWGPLHVFMTDGRFHSRRNDSILGDAQCQWLTSGLQRSASPIKIIVFGSQFLDGPSTAGFHEAAKNEQNDIKDWIENEVEGPVLLLCGDVHYSDAKAFSRGGKVRALEVTSSPMRVRTRKKWSDAREEDQSLWQTREDSFAVIEIDYRGGTGNAIRGTITVEALDDRGDVLKHRGSGPDCRTLWDLDTGSLT